MMRGVLLLAVLTLAPASASADWFVAWSTGSDLNACNAAGVPCHTINAAIARAQAGDTIFVTDDIYRGVGPAEIVHVDKSLTVSGGWNPAFTQQPGFTILDGEHQRRCLTVDPGADLEISQVAMIWGRAADGGGVYVGGGFRGSRLLIVQNRATLGGGIFFNGHTGDDMVLIDSVLLANEYSGHGGGLFVDGFRFDTPTDPSHVNSALLFNVTVSNGVSVNSFDEEHGTPPTAGGGVYVEDGFLEITHGTFAENAIWDGQKFTQNNAGIATNATAHAILRNTLIADGCSVGTPFFFVSEGFNVERGNTCNLTVPQDRHGVNPLIYPLNVNPGPYTTITYAIAWNSPAIDWAKPELCLPHDQRGMVRPFGIACDVGAFERTDSDPAKSLVARPGPGLVDPDRCPVLAWNPLGRLRPNPCRVDTGDLIRAILGPIDAVERGATGSPGRGPR